MLEILTHFFFRHTIWWDSFLSESMSTSCLSVRLIGGCITNYLRSFLSNYSLQMHEILTHSFFGMTYGGIHFCTNPMSTSCSSMHLECKTNFHRSFLSNYSLQMLEILTHSFFWHDIMVGSFLYESDVKFLYICVSVRKVYNKFSSQFPQQLHISGAWNFSTFFVLACHMMGIIFVRIRC
jgi:hypothetical protein